MKRGPAGPFFCASNAAPGRPIIRKGGVVATFRWGVTCNRTEGRALYDDL